MKFPSLEHSDRNTKVEINYGRALLSQQGGWSSAEQSQQLEGQVFNDSRTEMTSVRPKGKKSRRT